MKQRLFLCKLAIIALIICTISCRAQSPIIPLKDIHKQDFIENAYYKDIDGDLDKYVGTWKYINGTTSLTIEIRKLSLQYSSILKFYEDTLIAEYKYVKDGVVIMNYLSRLNDNNISIANHYINGNEIIYPYQYVSCDDCTHMERRIQLYFSDPERKYLSQALIARHVMVNGEEKIQANLRLKHVRRVPEGTILTPRIPYGNYILVKQ